MSDEIHTDPAAPSGTSPVSACAWCGADYGALAERLRAAGWTATPPVKEAPMPTETTNPWWLFRVSSGVVRRNLLRQQIARVKARRAQKRSKVRRKEFQAWWRTRFTIKRCHSPLHEVLQHD